MRSIVSGFGTASFRLYRNDAALAVSAGIMLSALVGCGIGLLVDPRTVLGAPVWLKPAKFALSIGLYCLTLAWVFGYIPQCVRTRRIVGWGSAAAMLIEMGIISLQAARGTTSHFNVSTPGDALLFSIMGIAIIAQTFASVAVAVALFKQQFSDPSFGWALRFGMVITIAGALMGGLMTKPTPSQLEQMQAGQVVTSGAHTVGGTDGEPGMPVTGWSRQHGDLRIPHFVALHALQLLPLFAMGLRRTRTSNEERIGLVKTFAATYIGFVGIVLWQALRGHTLFALEPGLLFALLSLAALALGFTWRVLGAGSAKQSSIVTVT